VSFRTSTLISSNSCRGTRRRFEKRNHQRASAKDPTQYVASGSFAGASGFYEMARLTGLAAEGRVKSERNQVGDTNATFTIIIIAA
jgi:hypothetical protein